MDCSGLDFQNQLYPDLLFWYSGIEMFWAFNWISFWDNLYIPKMIVKHSQTFLFTCYIS